MQHLEIRSHLPPQRRPGARRHPPAEARPARPEDPEDPRSGSARRVPFCQGLAGGNTTIVSKEFATGKKKTFFRLAQFGYEAFLIKKLY